MHAPLAGWHVNLEIPSFVGSRPNVQVGHIHVGEGPAGGGGDLGEVMVVARKHQVFIAGYSRLYVSIS